MITEIKEFDFGPFESLHEAVAAQSRYPGAYIIVNLVVSADYQTQTATLRVVSSNVAKQIYGRSEQFLKTLGRKRSEIK